jgi:DNA-directed RNA polymerase specialized sigma24 family protein
MSRDGKLTREDFEAMLAWLDSDRNKAAEKYTQIHTRLIKFFACRGCPVGDVLADRTINRVAEKVKEIEKDWVGENKSLYFYGVGHKIFLEWLREQRMSAVLPPPPPDTDEAEREDECLECCMESLSPDNRELILGYYREDTRAKIENRRAIADRLGIALNALRIRACRIRAGLQQCVHGCLEEKLA